MQPEPRPVSQQELLRKNLAIVEPVSGKVKGLSPDATLVVVAKPLDTLTGVAREATGWPKNRVFGMAGIEGGQPGRS